MALTTKDDVAKMLRWQQGEQVKYEEQLDGYIAAATQVIEAEIGPVETTTVTVVRDGGFSVTVPHRIKTVTSVTVDGSPVTAFTVDREAGILYGPFNRGIQNVTVVYTTGSDEVPPAVKLAAEMITVDMWAIASQRAPGLDDRVDTSYLMPKAVRNLLTPFYKQAGFA